MKDVDELYDTTMRLLDDLGERFDARQAAMVRSDLDAGEWPMAVDALLATLVKRSVELTPGEHRTVLAIAEDVGYGEERTGGLVVRAEPSDVDAADGDRA